MPPSLLLGKDAQVTFFDEVHRTGRISLSDHHRARGDRDGSELVEQELQSLRRQPGKRREMAEEVFELAMLDLELEINADVGALLQERLENGLVQAQRRHVARSTDGGRSGGMLEKAHLAEAVPRAQHAQGDLFALLGPLDD